VIFKVRRLQIEVKSAGITEPIIDQGDGHNAGRKRGLRAMILASGKTESS
jgi:hypothetical protein